MQQVDPRMSWSATCHFRLSADMEPGDCGVVVNIQGEGPRELTAEAVKPLLDALLAAGIEVTLMPSGRTWIAREARPIEIADLREERRA